LLWSPAQLFMDTCFGLIVCRSVFQIFTDWAD